MNKIFFLVPDFIKNLYKNILIKSYDNVFIEKSTLNKLTIKQIKNITFWKKNIIYFDNIIKWYLSIWDYSYIWSNNTFISNDDYKIKIWKYCCIADNIYMITINNHYYQLMTINNKLLLDIGKWTKITWGDIIIWNDVWIWSNVTILPWISIWNWAIIWAGSVITKNIEEYSIVWWVPAKLIKNRFTDEQINYIKKNNWYDKDLESISLFYDNFNKQFNINYVKSNNNNDIL